MRRPTVRFQLTTVGLACIALLSACGGGGDKGGSGSGGAVQSISFPFPGGPEVAVPPAVATTKLRATASSGGPVSYTSHTPDVCTVNGDTLSLLKAGECSVTATQAGFEDYAPASQRQLFVIPKRPHMVAFRNPGAQALDGKPVALAAVSDLDRPVTFESTTPAVCTVSGSTLTKVANGLCAVTAKSEGGDIFATATMTKKIPVGTEKAPVLTHFSGFKDATTTKENGTVNGFAGTSLNGWWCNGWCDQVLSGDGNNLRFTFNTKLDKPNNGSGIGGYYGLHVLAGGVKELSKAGPMASGARIDSQSTMTFRIAQNAEWINTGKNTINVDLVLGHFALKNGKDACNVTLRSKVKPVTTAATDYTVSLRDLTVAESCGLKDLNPWYELQDYPIAQVSFNADSMNLSVSSTPLDKPTYPTQLILTGPITFQ
jgi:hypothetical protein